MSQTVNVNGVSINYPETGDTGWGDEGTTFAVQTSSALSKLGLSTGTTVDIPGTLDVTGATTLDSNLSVGGNSTLTGNLTVNGNTILGNATSDTITITGSVAIDTNILIVDPTNSRVGINKTSPAQALDVVGAVAISGNETVGGTLGVTGNTTLSGQLLNSDGTASLPGISFSGDTNTGIYRSSSDQISISAGGSEVGRITTTYGGFKGNVIQVVSNGYSTEKSTTSTSYATTSLSCSITPKYNTSKILVLYMVGGCESATGSGIRFKLYKNGSELAGSFEDEHTKASNYSAAKYAGFFLDSPATTSSTTYELYYASRSGGTVYIHISSSNSYMVLLEVQQ